MSYSKPRGKRVDVFEERFKAMKKRVSSLRVDVGIGSIFDDEVTTLDTSFERIGMNEPFVPTVSPLATQDYMTSRLNLPAIPLSRRRPTSLPDYHGVSYTSELETSRLLEESRLRHSSSSLPTTPAVGDSYNRYHPPGRSVGVVDDIQLSRLRTATFAHRKSVSLERGRDYFKVSLVEETSYTVHLNEEVPRTSIGASDSVDKSLIDYHLGELLKLTRR